MRGSGSAVMIMVVVGIVTVLGVILLGISLQSASAEAPDEDAANSVVPIFSLGSAWFVGLAALVFILAIGYVFFIYLR